MTDLATTMDDTANALDIDASWWRSEAERDDVDPAEAARYLGRAEGMEWGALAIRNEVPPGWEFSARCAALWDGTEVGQVRCQRKAGHGGQHTGAGRRGTVAITAEWGDR